jgi:hypothetical protein
MVIYSFYTESGTRMSGVVDRFGLLLCDSLMS